MRGREKEEGGEEGNREIQKKKKNKNKKEGKREKWIKWKEWGQQANRAGWTSYFCRGWGSWASALWKAEMGGPRNPYLPNPISPQRPKPELSSWSKQKTNRAKWKHAGCLPLPSPCSGYGSVHSLAPRRPLGKQGAAFVTLLSLCLPPHSHPPPRAMDSVLFKMPWWWGGRAHGAWGAGRSLAFPALGLAKNRKMDWWLTGKGRVGTELHPLPNTGIGVLNQAKACPACVRAEKAGERDRVADKCWEGGAHWTSTVSPMCYFPSLVPTGLQELESMKRVSVYIVTAY